jgi:hypothetical protein
MQYVIGQGIKRTVEYMGVHYSEANRVAIGARASGATDADAPVRAADVLDDDALA